MKVCFVAENAYSLIVDGTGSSFGGMETQAWAFARALQQLNCCEISFAVSGQGKPKALNQSGIQILNRKAFIEHIRRNVAKHCTIRHAMYPVRLRKWSSSLLWQLPLLIFTRPFRSAESERKNIFTFYADLPVDVIITFGVSSLTTTIMEAARASGKRAVISCASNDDLRSEYSNNSGYVNAFGESAAVLSRGLSCADQIFVQTKWQQELAHVNLNRSTEVLPNTVDPRWNEWASQSDSLLAGLLERYSQLKRRFVLWTGRTERFHKRPEMAYEVASSLPAQTFVMVLNSTDPEYAEELYNQRPPNVLLLPPLKYPVFIALMGRAAAFLSTGSSQYEGFPNVFLQAGMLGVPVVSAEADFGILSETGIGRTFGDSVPAMAEALDQICTSEAHRNKLLEGVIDRTLDCFGNAKIAERLWTLLNTRPATRVDEL